MSTDHITLSISRVKQSIILSARNCVEEPTDNYRQKKMDKLKNLNSGDHFNWVWSKLTLPRCNGTQVKQSVIVPLSTQVQKVKLVTSEKGCPLPRESLTAIGTTIIEVLRTTETLTSRIVCQ